MTSSYPPIISCLSKARTYFSINVCHLWQFIEHNGCWWNFPTSLLVFNLILTYTLYVDNLSLYVKTQLLSYLLFQARHAEKIGVDAIACFAPGFYKAESEGKLCNCRGNSSIHQMFLLSSVASLVQWLSCVRTKVRSTQ